MKRLVGLVLIFTLLAVVASVVAGCGSTSETKEGTGIITPNGAVTIKRSGDTITVTKGKTTKKWTASTASEAALGFPVPSSAKLVSGTAIVIASAPEKWQGATFYSTEDVAAINSFYKSKLSSMSGYSDTSTTISGNAVGLFSIKSGGTVKSVIVRLTEPGEQGKTWITIATAAGAGL